MVKRFARVVALVLWLGILQELLIGFPSLFEFFLSSTPNISEEVPKVAAFHSLSIHLAMAGPLFS